MLKKVKIGAHIYEVIYRDDMDDEDMGVCRPRKLKLFVDDTVAQSQKEETFFHEVMHAIFNQTGLDKPLEDEKEEQMVQILGHAIYQVLKDNDLLK